MNTNVATVAGNIMKSMTMKIVAAAVAVSAVAAMVPEPSQAYDRRVERDILGRGVLGSGRSVLVDIDDGTGRCLYDFKAVFANGSVRTRYRVDVCSEDNWTIAR